MPFFKTATDRSLYYEYYPSSGPVTVLIHGWGLNSRAWDPTIDFLTGKGHAVMAFDQRACGQSDKDFPSASIEDGANDLLALINALAIDEVILNGWSQGGAVAVEAAALLGRACKALVLTCAATPRYTDAEDLTIGITGDVLAGMAASFRRDKVATALAVATGCFTANRSREDVAAVQRMFLQTGPMAIRTLEALGPLDQRTIMRNLHLPTLIMAGENDSVTPLIIAQTSHELIAQSRLVVLPECAHVPMIECYDQYHSELSNFIVEIKGGRP
ncbi:alpha/beta hydrolase [Sphingobium sp. JS3065]|uniref:alpha/beta fold hydrolase n=1 Tax=Sphingobium sp. JS3065 TaxID=2970925 RepID=UPI0022656D3F|nr:alpha/beta hydrolase [Sphingobium sp. JS3065]UZW56417.1 alpha/beta hydrolase [Sphingobium sp. JS3065]